MTKQDYTKSPANETIEIWRDIPGYEGYYQVSNLGKVKSLDRTIVDSRGNTRTRKGKSISPFDRKGYYSIMLWKDGKNKAVTIHRLIMLSFVGEPLQDDYHVNHMNGIKTDNRLENLEYVTPKRNMMHAIEIGLSNSWIGQNNPKSELNPNDIRKIRELYASGNYYLRELAERYGVTIQSIWAIVKRVTWQHID